MISIKIEIEVSWCELVSHAIVAVAAARSILLQMRGSESNLTLSYEILGPFRPHTHAHAHTRTRTHT